MTTVSPPPTEAYAVQCKGTNGWAWAGPDGVPFLRANRASADEIARNHAAFYGPENVRVARVAVEVVE